MIYWFRNIAWLQNIICFFKLDFRLLYNMQKNALLMNKEKERLTSEMRYLHSKGDREANFEKKAKISLKVQRWYTGSEFSDEIIKEAEEIQLTLNAIFRQAEFEDEKNFVVKEPEIISVPKEKQEVSGLGNTVR